MDYLSFSLSLLAASVAPDPTATGQCADPDILSECVLVYAVCQLCCPVTLSLAAIGLGHLLEITDYLHTLVDKREISSLGLILGLYADRLKWLEQNSHDFLDDVVYAWLRREGDVDKRGGPRWSTLVNALNHRRLRQTGIANAISKDKGLDI